MPAVSTLFYIYRVILAVPGRRAPLPGGDRGRLFEKEENKGGGPISPVGFYVFTPVERGFRKLLRG